MATLVRVTAAALTVFTIAAAAAAAALLLSPLLALSPWSLRPSRAVLFLAFFAFFFAHCFCQHLRSFFLSFASCLPQLSMLLLMCSIWRINVMFIVAPMPLDDP